MSISKSLKNIFLGIIFFCFFLVPNVVKAGYDVKGDTSKSINNLSTGSYYITKDSYDSETGMKIGVDIFENENGKGNESLFNDDEKTAEININRIQALRIKLKNGGSSVDTTTIGTQNTRSINTPQGSIFVHKKADGSEWIVGLATKDDRMYIPKDPVLKDSASVGQDSLDPKTGNGFLNLTDQDRGIALGTTVGFKNKEYNIVKDQEKVNGEIDEIDKEIKKQEEIRDNPRSTPQEIASASKAIEDARLKKTGLETEKERLRVAAENERNRKLATGQNIDNDCKSVVQQFSFYCMTWTVAKFTNVIFKLMSFVAYVTGTLFDYSLELSMNSAEFFKKLGVVEITWSFIRDILNITFIFILLWTAIQILLGKDEQYNAKKILMNVVIFAILINFSLFAAKVMVDGSNIVSLKLYESMKASTDEKSATISERVMKTVGLSALYDVSQIFQVDKTATMSACATNPGGLITISVSGSIFLAILSLALGLAAALFLIRLVNILILFIKSPLWVWGFVLPGSKTMTKIRNDWWNSMMHVLTFPIMYMFWMLVAIIVFGKLGDINLSTVTGEKMTLLNLICSDPGKDGFSSSISLVAIFVIVIIFMMQAIKYGVDHATTPEQSFGGGMGKNIAGKFGGWQDALTTKLHKTSWNAAKTTASATATVAGAGIGAAKYGLTLAGNQIGRVGMGAITAARGEGFSEGFLNPGINSKEWLRNKARTIAANNNNILGDAAAKFANKYDDPKNSANLTRKEVEAKRVATAKENAELRTDAIDKKYKVVGQKEWLKKNEGKTLDDYEKHVEETMAKRIDALFGKDAHKLRDKDGVSRIDTLRKVALDKTPDKDGNPQVRFKEHAMHDVIESMIKYHTGDGAGVTDKNFEKDKKRFELFGNKRAAARIKVISDKTKRYQSDALTKDHDKKTAENQIQELKEAIDYIEKLPEESALDACINNTTGPVKYTGHGDSDKKTGLTKFNTCMEHLIQAKASGVATPSVITTLEENVKTAKKEYVGYLKKQKNQVLQKQNKLAEKIKKEAEASENKDKK